MLIFLFVVKYIVPFIHIIQLVRQLFTNILRERSNFAFVIAEKQSMFRFLETFVQLQDI